MEPQVRARFTPDVKAAVARAAGVGVDDLIEHDGFDGNVHEVLRGDTSIFLKSMWSGRRTPQQIEAEMAFVRLLADAGVRVASPVRLQGQDVVSIPAQDGAFHVSATERAPGEMIYRTELGDEHFVQWGRLLGRMHRGAALPDARRLIARRPSWQEELEPLATFAPDPRIVARYRSLLNGVARLSTDPAGFGLMHTDLHASNVHWQGTIPTAFDFDDCLGFWYASDIAIVLFYTLRHPPGSDEIQTEYARNLASLRRGYESVHALPEEAWGTLPLFLNLRDAVLFLVCERSVPPSERTERLTMLMEQRLERLVTGQNAMGLRL